MEILEKIDIKDIQNALFDIALNFHDIMVKHKIPYYMIGGTMLGAIRHKGFIPWDDDMDFGIPRQYYDKALIILEKELPSKYRLFKATDGAVNYDSSKIENINTIIEEIGSNTSGRGLFIDIFPLDKCNKNWGVLSRNWWIKHLLGINIYKYQWPKTFVEKNVAFVVRLFPKNFFNNLAKRMIIQNGDYYINYGGFWGQKEIIPINIFGTPLLYQYEDSFLYGVEKYDDYLKLLYKDYMTLPPEDKRHIHIKRVRFKI